MKERLLELAAKWRGETFQGDKAAAKLNVAVVCAEQLEDALAEQAQPQPFETSFRLDVLSSAVQRFLTGMIDREKLAEAYHRVTHPESAAQATDRPNAWRADFVEPLPGSGRGLGIKRLSEAVPMCRCGKSSLEHPRTSSYSQSYST